MCRARRGCTARSTSSHCRVRMRDWRASLAHCRSSAHLLLPPPSPPPSPRKRSAPPPHPMPPPRPPPAVELALKAAAVGDGRGELLALHIDRCASSALVAGGGGAMCCGHRDAGEPCAERAERGASMVDGRVEWDVALCGHGVHSARRTGGAGRVEGAAHGRGRHARRPLPPPSPPRSLPRAGRPSHRRVVVRRPPALHICGGHAARRHAIGSGRQKAGGGGAWSAARRT